MLKHGYLEALARQCGHDTDKPFDEFKEFEETFEHWYSHILVSEYIAFEKTLQPYCHVSPKCVYSDLNLFAQFARKWILENALVHVAGDEYWEKLKEVISVTFLGSNELTISITDEYVTKSLKVVFIDYNQINPTIENGDKWYVHNDIPS